MSIAGENPDDETDNIHEEAVVEDGSDDGENQAAFLAAAASALNRRRKAGRKDKQQNSFSSGRSGVGVGLMLFILGLACGLPLAMLGFDSFVKYSAAFYGFLLGLLGTSIALLILILIFRRPIWQRLYNRGEVEVERLAEPLADMARNAAKKDMDGATDAAKNFAELILARWAWLMTRRWLVGSVTGLLAAIAALAGSTLLFQQNKLLAEQSVLIAGQTDRLDMQNYLLETQISLAEAERSALIGPELLAIGEKLGEETSALRNQGNRTGAYVLEELSPGLLGRMVALTNLARPYRYLQPGEVDPRDSEAVLRKAMQKRPEIFGLQPDARAQQEQKGQIGLIPEPVSPERGQILTMLLGAGIRDTELLSFRGADFSFAEFRMRTLGQTSYRHAQMGFARFAEMVLVEMKFGDAVLDHANFERALISKCDFSGIRPEDIKPPFVSSPDLAYHRTSMTGTRFGQTIIVNARFEHISGLVVDFGQAALYNTSFRGAYLDGSIFRNTLLLDVNFENASLKALDLEGALVFEKDFLDRLEKTAQKGTFRKSRWQMAHASRAEVEA
ncbi:MAG TPA: pentapeptide repeat-containing protein, partial [Hellea balneolensis]|nr:pentapeptide repeat-containing protein [Hellea balneolensis]